MKPFITTITPLFAAVALFGMQASTVAADSKLSAYDQKFITKAAQDGLTEVQLGQLARSKAERAEVKDFGKMMVSHHSKANEKLMKVAAQKGEKVSVALDEEHSKKVDKMSKLSGKEFDAAYIPAMVKGHEKDVAEFEKATRELSDPDLKAFATETLPTLKMHLKTIKQIQDGKQ